jgi:hypothetical protein
MAEEQVEQTQEASPDQEVQLSPIQQKALEQGWKPKDQFEGDEEEFIDAPEFVRRGELFGKIEHQSREMKAMKQALEALKQHNSKIEQSAYDRALKALQDQRSALRREGEHEEADKVADQIDSVKAEKERVAREASLPAVPEVDPAFMQWVDRNTWYTKDVAMQAVADRVGLEMARRGVPQAEVLRKVEETVRQEFPHKFANQKTERPNAVAASSRGGSSVARAGTSLSEDERKIMRKIVGTGVMTEAEYMSQLKKSEGR